MKNFFDYDANSPQERQERFEHFPELSKFYIALSEELAQEEYENFVEAEKQYYHSSLNSTNKQAQWIR